MWIVCLADNSHEMNFFFWKSKTCGNNKSYFHWNITKTNNNNKQIPWAIYVPPPPPPPLFLFEVLKMGKLTRGPLVLYHLPKYWSRKPVIKNYFRILKNPHAYLQTILKAQVKVQKDRPKIVGRVKGTRYLLPTDFCNIRTQKMSVQNV